MKELKKSPRQQLEKFSTIFMQLGLVLVLFIVFISLEYETEHTAFYEEPVGQEIPDDFIFDKPIVYVKEVTKKPQRVVERRVITTIIDKPEVVDNTDPVETVINKPIDDEPTIDIAIVDDVPEDEYIDPKEDPTPVAINYVSKIPVFKGCENLSETDSRKCFDKKMKRLVNRYFDAELGSELGLKKGKHKITTQFVIDKTGKITDVKIRAPHVTLKSEVNRVVKKIPEFTPGENNGKAVNVRYILPISFEVE